MRRSIFALRPANLEEMGLAPAVEEVAKTIAQQYQLPVHTELSIDDKVLDPGLELHLFHIAGELLSNAARHAQAGAIWLVVDREREHVRLQVRDDGQGFDPASLANLAAKGHLGLRYLRERVTLLGGTFSLDSRPGGGTRVTVLVPTKQEL